MNRRKYMVAISGLLIILILVAGVTYVRNKKESNENNTDRKEAIMQNSPIEMQEQRGLVLYFKDVVTEATESFLHKEVDIRVKINSDSSKTYYQLSGDVITLSWTLKYMYSKQVYINSCSKFEDVKLLDPYTYLIKISDVEGFSEHLVGESKILRIQYRFIDDEWEISTMDDSIHESSLISFISEQETLLKEK